MAASSDAHCKGWYGRQLDRLHREAPAVNQTVPEDALRHLPVEYLATVLDTTFRNYDTRAATFAERCLADGDMDTFLAFIKAHHDILERFEVSAPNHYRDMARIIGDHFIRKAQREVGIEIKPTYSEVYATKNPHPPPSTPPTLPSIQSWINKVDNSYSEPPPRGEEISPGLASTAPADSTSSGAYNLVPGSSRNQANSQPPRRELPPRKAKKSSNTPPSTTQDRIHRNIKKARKASKIEISAVPEESAKTTERGAKRQRAEDGMISPENSDATPKRRRIAKPAANVRR